MGIVGPGAIGIIVPRAMGIDAAYAYYRTFVLRVL